MKRWDTKNQKNPKSTIKGLYYVFRGNALRDTSKGSIERKRNQVFIPHDKFSKATHRIDASIKILTTRNAGWENFDEKNVARETTGTIKISTYSKPLIKVIL